jgi:hypothetical protein
MIEVNKVVVSIDVCGDDIMITTEDGTKYHFYHEQDCCESVRIYDWKGDYNDLVGKELLYIEDDNDDFTGKETVDPWDCYTCTNIKFVTNENTVVSRWIGESNGYYSESVDIEVLSKNQKSM